MKITNGQNNEQHIKIPYPVGVLFLVAVIMYLPSLLFNLTRLDDVVFIYRYQHYYQHLGNLLVSFRRGIFATSGDYFYRPVFMGFMQLNSRFWGTNVMCFHAVNILLHATVVALMYRLLVRLKVNPFSAFLITLVFAVHPVLVQAVAWIPGCNDSLLAVFVLLFLGSSIRYAEQQQGGRVVQLLLSVFFLLLAVFTKETGVLAPIAAWVLLFTYIQGISWKSKHAIVQYVAWVSVLLFWYYLRSQANIMEAGYGPLTAVKLAVYRLPVLVQYMGKVFIPTHLSVYPMQKDAHYFFGALAIAGVTLLLFCSSKENRKRGVGGIAVFLLFLVPALLVPQKISFQLFEHRLYLPFFGMLLFLPSTVLFNNKLGHKALMLVAIPVLVVFSMLNWRHQQNFKNANAFWSQAVASTPGSGFAKMMLAMQLNNLDSAKMLFQEAQQMSPGLPLLNFNIGLKLQSQKAIQASEPYFLAEQKKSGYYECRYYLAKCAFAKNDIPAAINYFKLYLAKDKANTTTETETYLNDTRWQQPESAQQLLNQIFTKNIYHYREAFHH